MKYITDLTSRDVIAIESQEELNEIKRLSSEAGYPIPLIEFSEGMAVRPKGMAFASVNSYIRANHFVHQASEFIEQKVQVSQIKTNTMKNLQVVKTKKVTIGTQEREITVAVVVTNGEVRTGYSVKSPNDESNPKLAEKIALGRALSDKTNLTAGMIMGIGMDKKFILYSIADDVLIRFERGRLEIKGIK